MAARKSIVRLILGSLISLVFLVLAVRGIQWSEFISVLGRTHYWYLIPAAGLTILGHYIRAYRWKYILLPVKRIATWSLFSSTMIGMMANNILPVRIGELLRVYAIGRSESISVSASFATIVYERLVDVFGLLVLLWLMLLRSEGPAWLQRAGFVILAVNAALLVFLILLERYKDIIGKLWQRLGRPLPDKARRKVGDIIESFSGGLRTLRDKNVILPIIGTSVLIWLAPILRVYICFLALDLQLPLFAAISVLVLTTIGSMIPSAPGYIGTTQYACVISLGLFGIGNGEALAYSVLLHLTQIVPNVIVGLYFMWRAGMSFGDVPEK
ncbi:MAG: lysylphosphatidylglycerol synthase transmembrane domain-containing protein [Candidatus Latescibacterota bacterium]